MFDEAGVRQAFAANFDHNCRVYEQLRAKGLL